MTAKRSDIDVEISEVGPRDGLQMIKEYMPTAGKQAWVAAEAAAGVREIEVCSYVPAKVVAQFTDADAVVAHARTIPDLTVAVLVPNLRGAERAITAGAHKLSFPISASHGHSLSNVRKTPDEQVAELGRIVAAVRALPPDRRPQVSAGLSTAFGCSIDGTVPEAQVLRLIEAALAAGADDVGLADTVGCADPAQVKRLFLATRRAIGEAVPLGAHLHNTMGLGLANAMAALEAGVRSFDSSLGGLGGCPFAPGATGNIVTEDLVFMLHALGLRTGIDLDRLAAVRDVIKAAMPGIELYGHFAAAGWPKRLRVGAPAIAAE
jgi:hydroxymethylglutaryl-CoA lyase